MRRYPWRALLLIGILVAVAATSLAFNRFDINLLGLHLKRDGLVLGLDLRGGSHLVYQAVSDEDVPSSVMEGLVSTIERRINASGVAEADVRLLGDNRVLVQLPGVGKPTVELAFQGPVEEINDLRQVFADLGRPDAVIREEDTRTFTVELRHSLKSEERDAEGNILKEAEADTLQEALVERVGPLDSFTVTGGIEEVKRRIGQTASLRFVERDCIDLLCTTFTDNATGLGGEHLAQAFPDTDQVGRPVVGLRFKREGTKLFADITDRLVGTEDQLAIFLDDLELFSGTTEYIPSGNAIIRGSYTAERVRELVILLESGRLPIDIQVVQERDVDASLGEESLRKSLVAGVVGLALVGLFMVLYYRLPGILAALSLGIYTLMVLAVFKLVPVTLTLSGIAAFILSIGMAVDANILIFERMKEELHSGRTLRAAVESGFDRAWTSIRDSNISTLITCGILWWFGDRLGVSVVQGFALTLAIGVAISLFSSITVSRTLLRLAVQTPLAGLLGLFVPVTVRRPAPPRPVLGEPSGL